MIDKFREHLQQRRKETGINFIFCLEYVRYEFDLDKWLITEVYDKADAIQVTIASQNSCIMDRHIKDAFYPELLNRMIIAIEPKNETQKLK